MRAIDKLKAAVSMEPMRRSVTLPNGDELEWWMSPLTIAQRQRAQKNAGTDDAVVFALNLLVLVAKDENGSAMFNAGDLPELRNLIPADLVDDILLQMIRKPNDDEDDEELFDPKSSKPASKRTPG